MLIALITAVVTSLFYYSLARRYAIVEVSWTYSPASLTGKVRDVATGLVIGQLSGGGEPALYLSGQNWCIESGTSVRDCFLMLPRYVGGRWFFRTSKHECRMIANRTQYNNLLQYASGRKKSARTGVACC